MVTRVIKVQEVEGYESLSYVLTCAYKQAAVGKGAERHANGLPFHDQPMQSLIRAHGLGFATGQACKKAEEALGLPTIERQINELLGAIVYLAGAIVHLEMKSDSNAEQAECQGQCDEDCEAEVVTLSPEDAEILKSFFKNNLQR